MKKHIDWAEVFIYIGVAAIVIFIILMIFATIYNYNEQKLITSGYVIDKNFNKAYTSHDRHKVGDQWIENSTYHEATYHIYIQSDDGNHKAWYEVTEYIYNQYKIGDHIKNVNRELK